MYSLPRSLHSFYARLPPSSSNCLQPLHYPTISIVLSYTNYVKSHDLFTD